MPGAAIHLPVTRAARAVMAETDCARGSRGKHRTRAQHCCADAGPLQQAPSVTLSSVAAMRCDLRVLVVTY